MSIRKRTVRKRLYRVTTDKKFSPGLRRQFAEIRGAIAATAERQPLPGRFTVRRGRDRPDVVFIDQETGRRTTVALCNYRGVREALWDLFSRGKRRTRTKRD